MLTCEVVGWERVGWGGGGEFFKLKNAFKVVECCVDVGLKIWVNAPLLRDTVLENFWQLLEVEKSGFF